jgi:protein gp37
MNNTIISWTDLTWNVWSGCSKVSPGCAHCYAETLSENKRGTRAFPVGFDLTYRWHKLLEPLKLKGTKRIFVNSMSDLYYEAVPLSDIQRVFEVMNECHARGLGHQFQILTKRSERMLELSPKLTFTPNIWQGVSVENQRWTSRLDDLVEVPAEIRFVSVEPMLGPVDLTEWLDRLHWIIVGGESGPGYRPMEREWVYSVRDQCRAANVAFFFKQDSAFRTETRAYIVEEGGRKMRYMQFPGILLEPVETDSLELRVLSSVTA